jgi:ABC transport system ATP-binding/permease protein
VRNAPKRSYKEQRELEQLPVRIETLEQSMNTLQAQLADPAFYRQDAEAIAATRAQLDALGAELQAAYARWEALEAQAG